MCAVVVLFVVCAPAVYAAFTAGTTTTFDTNSTQNIAILAIDSDTSVIAYRDVDSGNDGVAVVATIVDGSMTYGTPVVFDAVLAVGQNITKLDATRVAIGYYDVIAGGAKIVIGTIDGTNITFGDPVIVSAASARTAQIAALSSTKLLISYRDAANSNYGTAVIGTVTGDDIEMGTVAVYEDSATAPYSVQALSGTHAAVVYTDSADEGYVVIADASGAVPSFGTPVRIGLTDTYIPSMVALASDTVVIGFRDATNGNNGHMVVGMVSGTTIILGDVAVFDTSYVQYISFAKLDATHTLVAYQDGGNSNFGTALVATLGGDGYDLSFSDELIFEDATTQFIGVSEISATDTAIAYNTGDFGKALVTTYDETAPSVSTLSPADGASSVAVDANLVITFDETISSSGTGTVSIYRSSDDVLVEQIDITGSLVTGSGTTQITLNPTSSLAAGTAYYIQITSNAFPDAYGNSYAGISDTTTWNFTTVAAASSSSSSSTAAQSGGGRRGHGTSLTQAVALRWKGVHAAASSSHSSSASSVSSSSSSAPAILALEDPFFIRTCDRVIKWFAGNGKMLGRVNDRLQSRFGFVCTE